MSSRPVITSEDPSFVSAVIWTEPVWQQLIRFPADGTWQHRRGLLRHDGRLVQGRVVNLVELPPEVRADFASWLMSLAL